MAHPQPCPLVTPSKRVLTTGIIGLSVTVLKSLIGEQWQAVYKNGDPETDTPLHPAILQLLDAALNKQAEQLRQRAPEDRSKAKADAKTALDDVPKRRRAA